jgi:predicted DNA-binding protein
MTVRLDRRMRVRLAAAARRRGRTASDLARAALEGWLDDQEGQPGGTPYEAVADLIGSVRGGDEGRSQRSGRAIAAALRGRQGRRR